MYVVLLVGAGAIFAIAMWLRRLVREQKIPRWARVTTLVALVVAAAGNAFTIWMLQRAENAVEGWAAEKAVTLARSISYAMNANAAVQAILVAAAVFLAVFEFRRRR